MIKNSYSVIIPVYNSQKILPFLVKQLDRAMTKVKKDYEIILINDGSQDKSWEIIVNLSQKYLKVKGVNLMRNYGQHNALLCGIRLAQYKFIITMDDDLQHSPVEIFRLIKKINKGYDVVYGMPHKTKHILWRNFASKITKLALQSIMGVDIARKVSAFRIFRTSLRKVFENYHAANVSIDVLLTWSTVNFSAISIKHKPRLSGKSNYSFKMLLNHAISMITGFSALPLQFASFLGFGFTIFGFGILIYVIGRYFIIGDHVAGFPFLASIVSIFSGVQLFAIGIIGEYIAKVYFSTLNHPIYVIKQQTKK